MEIFRFSNDLESPWPYSSRGEGTRNPEKYLVCDANGLKQEVQVRSSDGSRLPTSMERAHNGSTRGDGEEFTAATADEELVRQCLEGSDAAWATLIDKYRNLIFSIPIKYGFSADEAADIFQEVCLALLSGLSSLREPRALAGWLIKVTSHECVHWRRKQSRFLRMDFQPADVSQSMVDELRFEQTLREAISGLADRCRDLIHMLFFTAPAMPYDEVARRFGVAKGSIGFIRMRCLERLRRRLESSGFPVAAPNGGGAPIPR
jgi:RNA polymerase sigma factor (sigma-70 family)